MSLTKAFNALPKKCPTCGSDLFLQFIPCDDDKESMAFGAGCVQCQACYVHDKERHQDFEHYNDLVQIEEA